MIGTNDKHIHTSCYFIIKDCLNQNFCFILICREGWLLIFNDQNVNQKYKTSAGLKKQSTQQQFTYMSNSYK